MKKAQQINSRHFPEKTAENQAAPILYLRKRMKWIMNNNTPYEEHIGETSSHIVKYIGEPAKMKGSGRIAGMTPDPANSLVTLK